MIRSKSDEKFFGLYEKQADLNYKGARHLKDLMEYYKKVSLMIKSVSKDEDRKWIIRIVNQSEISRIVRDIRDIEDEGRTMLREFISILNKNLITPIDSDDLYELATKLKATLEYIYSVAYRIELYRVQWPDKFSYKLINVLISMTEESKDAFNILRRMGDVKPHIQKMSLLERKGSEAYIESMSILFQQEDEKEIIKWNDIYIRLRKAILCCTQLSQSIEYMIIKYV